ncbi:hypothetical protein BDR03DRAFT_937423 [Suillus americanus]|nr:hypothetical protein BDR03DRAFT_937423 [Suillus americanus]
MYFASLLLTFCLSLSFLQFRIFSYLSFLLWAYLRRRIFSLRLCYIMTLQLKILAAGFRSCHVTSRYLLV